MRSDNVVDCSKSVCVVAIVLGRFVRVHYKSLIVGDATKRSERKNALVPRVEGGKSYKHRLERRRQPKVATVLIALQPQRLAEHRVLESRGRLGRRRVRRL